MAAVTPMPDGCPILLVGWAGTALEGDESGDLHVVVQFEGGALVALIDGLGHGAEAADAARAAARILEAHAREPVLALVDRCHAGLRLTRGAVMSIASFAASDSSITWVGVGNVDGVLLRARGNLLGGNAAILTRGGVVGYQLPLLRAATVPLTIGDTLIMTTDGIRSGFAQGLDLARSPEEIAEGILSGHSKGTDDARVVVARYTGGAS